MIQSRLDTQRLNQRLSTANQDIHRMLMSRDEHVEAERLNIARELHDDVAQELTFLNVQLQLCQKEISQTPQEAQARLTAMRNEVSEILKHVRQLSRDLRPEPLYALGFLAALDQFLEKLRAQQPDINLVLKTELLPDAAHRSVESLLGDRDQLHLFRVVQEGIRNALKHSQAKTVEITVKESRDGYAIVIDDDGVGLPWTMMPNDAELVQQGHLGVVGMKERITELKGQLTLQARAQQRGSRLKIEVPLS